jgi:hypothetical protein
MTNLCAVSQSLLVRMAAGVGPEEGREREEEEEELGEVGEGREEAEKKTIKDKMQAMQDIALTIQVKKLLKRLGKLFEYMLADGRLPINLR